MLLALYVGAALVLSFLCSVAEAVLLSITPSYIEDQRERHPGRAALLQRLKLDNVDRSLAAILTLNTIAHTGGAVGAGAQATKAFGDAWLGLFSAAMTLAILFLSEIVPKTIGAVYWPRLVAPAAYFVQGLIVLLYPLVWMSESLTRLIVRGRATHVFSRDEFVALARMGERTGQLHENESRVIRNLFRLNSMRARDIMTPRAVVSALSEDTSVREALAYISGKPFSRLPVYKTDLDDASSFVLRNDIMFAGASGRENETLASIKRYLPSVPESAMLSMLLDILLRERHQMALVVDEYGGTSGIVTLEDLVETLLGVEIMDEKDSVEDLQARARQLWKKRARTLGIDIGE